MPNYHLHNVTRGRGNRNLRATSASHLRFKQHVMPEQRRLVRARPLVISEEQFQMHLEEFRTKAEAGILEVRTEDGRLMDLYTLQPIEGLPLERKPFPRLDTVKNDKPAGEAMPQFRGENEDKNKRIPSLLQKSAEELAEEAAEVPVSDTALEEAIREEEEPEPTFAQEPSPELSDAQLEALTAPAPAPEVSAPAAKSEKKGKNK